MYGNPHLVAYVGISAVNYSSFSVLLYSAQQIATKSEIFGDRQGWDKEI